MLKTCVVCGKEFETNRPYQVTCGKRCRKKRDKEQNRSLYQAKKQERKACLFCGQTFLGNANQKCCSYECAAYWREKNKNRKESLCWSCIHAVPSMEKGTGCSWSRSVGKIPVKGCEYAEKVCYGNYNGGKLVLKTMTKCPQYSQDRKARR